MAKYLVIHPVGKDLTLEAAAPVGKAVRAGVSSDAYWVRSWYAREEGRLYCEWDARDGETIRQVLHKTAPDFPVGGVYQMEYRVDSEDYRQPVR